MPAPARRRDPCLGGKMWWELRAVAAHQLVDGINQRAKVLPKLSDPFPKRSDSLVGLFAVVSERQADIHQLPNHASV